MSSDSTVCPAHCEVLTALLLTGQSFCRVNMTPCETLVLSFQTTRRHMPEALDEVSYRHVLWTIHLPITVLPAGLSKSVMTYKKVHCLPVLI